ncbi:MAG: hypothetical protein ONB13_10635 [candidate division KSB1 bacterium]|nr:hypothetical protein [candidate division KSB1 bacterium]
MEKILIAFLKMTARYGKPQPVVDIFGTLSGAKSVIVIMPKKLDDFGIARRFMATMVKDFAPARLIFVMKPQYRSLLNGDQDYGIIFVSETDVNFWGLPKKEIVKKVVATACDIVIDLNNEFDLPSTYLCLKSRASLKICFDHEKREPFYNFYFRTPADLSLSSKYKKLLHYLKNRSTAETVDA